MNVTTTGLTRAAGAAAAVAGAIFIGVQINHPPMDVVLGRHDRVGVAQHRQGRHGRPRAGRHHRHVPAARYRKIGVLGLVGYLLFSAGYLVILGIAFVAAYVLPTLADTAPGVRPATSSSLPRAAAQSATSA